MRNPLVSVIIPCYNQAHFLNEAIESVLAQSYQTFEIIVVDDGSTDGTADVATNYEPVHYIRQDNQGLAAARNTGLRHSTGEYLVFLDADDRLLPVALESGVTYLETYRECAFVSGHYRLMAADGTVLPTWLEQRRGDAHGFTTGDYTLMSAAGSILQTVRQPHVASHHYTILLQRNYIVMHATVMYRRTVFGLVGEFNPALRACEDYDLYLRIARQCPIACHDQVVADYRQHSTNMTRSSKLMTASVLTVLRSQWPYVQKNPTYETAYKIGEQLWRDYYAKQAITETQVHLRRGALKQALPAIGLLAQYGWLRFKRTGGYALVLARSWKDTLWQRRTRLPVGRVNFGALRQITLHTSGLDLPKMSVNRYYTDHFLSSYAADIQQCVLEVGDGSYTQQLANNSDASSRGEGKPNVTVLADLASAGNLEKNRYDCIILPHVLHQVYEIKAAAQTVYHLLRPGGILLATLPGMSLNQWADASYWAFTSHSARQLFAEIFPAASFTVREYGNVLAATALLHGVPASELCPAELDHSDFQYQVLIGVRAVKPRI
jgi:glycosyltransferase involved in cell wall biosynthesis